MQPLSSKQEGSLVVGQSLLCFCKIISNVSLCSRLYEACQRPRSIESSNEDESVFIQQLDDTIEMHRYARRLEVKALVVFDYAQPALWLGTALIGSGVSLYNLRNVQPVIAKDSDVALSCILVFSGGILIFQVHRQFCKDHSKTLYCKLCPQLRNYNLHLSVLADV